MNVIRFQGFARNVLFTFFSSHTPTTHHLPPTLSHNPLREVKGSAMLFFYKEFHNLPCKNSEGFVAEKKVGGIKFFHATTTTPHPPPPPPPPPSSCILLSTEERKLRNALLLWRISRTSLPFKKRSCWLEEVEKEGGLAVWRGAFWDCHENQAFFFSFSKLIRPEKKKGRWGKEDYRGFFPHVGN